MRYFEKLVEEALEAAGANLLEFSVKVLHKELRDQGHVLTGSLLRTTSAVLRRTRGGYSGEVRMNDYFAYLERRLPPERVPYSPGSGARRSKVVDALIRYWRLRGLPPDEAKSASFATLNKWKREGRPTRASFRFSKNGRRTGFLERSIEEITARADDVLTRGATNEIEKALVAAVRTAIRGAAVARN